MNNSVSIRNLRQYGNNGYAWTQIETNDFGQKCEAEYRTNDAGEGLFLFDGSGKQLTGTMQFSLRGMNKRSAYAKIRRYALS